MQCENLFKRQCVVRTFYDLYAPKLTARQCQLHAHTSVDLERGQNRYSVEFSAFVVDNYDWLAVDSSDAAITPISDMVDSGRVSPCEDRQKSATDIIPNRFHPVHRVGVSIMDMQ